jgi:DNA-binding CsgD family transcriptional regulator
VKTDRSFFYLFFRSKFFVKKCHNFFITIFIFPGLGTMETFFRLTTIFLGSSSLLFFVLYILTLLKNKRLSFNFKQAESFKTIKIELEEKHGQESEKPIVSRPEKAESENQEGDKIEKFCKMYKIARKEKEIIKELLKGLQCKEIASKKGNSVHTIRNHIRHIYAKCKVQNRVELINRIDGVM